MRFLFGIAILVAVGFVGWDFIPQNTQDTLRRVVGIIQKGDTQEFKTFIGDTVIPKNPKEQRDILIGELQKRTMALKERIAFGLEGMGGNEEVKRIIQETEEILANLQESNEDVSLREKITEVVFDNILFSRKEQKTECDCPPIPKP